MIKKTIVSIVTLSFGKLEDYLICYLFRKTTAGCYVVYVCDFGNVKNDQTLALNNEVIETEGTDCKWKIIILVATFYALGLPNSQFMQ